MIKRLSSSDNWRIYDDQRENFDGNQISRTLYPNDTPLKQMTQEAVWISYQLVLR